ncbi:MAG: MBL fold metallo-hydrolase [Peptococcaceae bacterium]|jgi:L-ascorbate metabolism protein UlaG (beta-lactamase superfamily)|nr:MBL fold metallo-hydrolase [Peptococcaceae bacterium]
MLKEKVYIKYLYHSGFQVEIGDTTLIFDYIKGPVDISNKNTLVFVSHSHPDHYNKEIFTWQSQNSEIKYILADEIRPEQPAQNIFSLAPYEEAQLGDVKVKTFGSTDLGVSFLVQIQQVNIFHAGDFNWWYWYGETPAEIAEAERLFKEEIVKIKGEMIDIALFPVDQRLEHNYCVGADYFIAELKPKYLVPMHFGDCSETPQKYAAKMKDSATKVVSLNTPGQSTTISLQK